MHTHTRHVLTQTHILSDLRHGDGATPHMHARTRAHTHTHKHTHTYIHYFACVTVTVRIHTHIHTHTHSHTHTYTHTHTTHTRTNTHSHTWSNLCHSDSATPQREHQRVTYLNTKEVKHVKRDQYLPQKDIRNGQMTSFYVTQHQCVTYLNGKEGGAGEEYRRASN